MVKLKQLCRYNGEVKQQLETESVMLWYSRTYLNKSKVDRCSGHINLVIARQRVVHYHSVYV